MSSGCFPLSRRETCLLALLLVCYTYFFPRYADWNQNSRLDLVLAIVDQGRLEIDAYAENTGDYAELNGHRYSDKAPGPAFLGIPVYVVTRWILAAPAIDRLVERAAERTALRETLRGGEAPRSKVRFAVAQASITWVVVAIPSALLGLALYRLLGELTTSETGRLAITLGYGLATSAFPYAGNYYSHQLSAALLVFSLCLLWRGRSVGRARLVVVGAMLGLALIGEYSTALIAGPLALYALYHRPRVSTALWLAGGMAPPLLAMALHNLAIFGSPLPVGYAYSALWQAEHTTGFFSLTYPHPDALWGITFSPFRGLFFVSPFLLLGLAGLVLFGGRPGYRAEFLICAWGTLSYFAFNSASIMWSGGFAVGPRYLVPTIPLLVLPLALAWERWGRAAWFRVTFGALLVWSFVVTWALTIATQSFPTYVAMPLWERSLPALLAGDVARNWGTLAGLPGLWSVLPLAATAAVLLGRLGLPSTGAPSPSSADRHQRVFARDGSLLPALSGRDHAR